MTSILLWVAETYDPAAALRATQINAILWSLADIAIVAAVLDAVDFLRRREGAENAAYRRWILAATILLTPGLVFAADQREVFILESVICGLQFLVLAETAWRERTRLLEAYFEIRSRRAGVRYSGRR